MTEAAMAETDRELSESRFEAVFGRRPDVTRGAPGRVNLIGEHTDYSGGFVMPMAIPQHTWVSVAHRPGREVRVASEAMPGLLSFELGRESLRGAWIDYVQGITGALRDRGHSVSGFDASVRSSVPVGRGLSSSAALGVALLRTLRDAFDLTLDDVEIARVARASENDFVGVPVGIMDPMASSLADTATALFLDTRSLAFERVALPATTELVVIDSGVAHAHATGDYATRKAECERAAALLGVESLRDVDDPGRAAGLPAPFDRRARHVVSENKRVLDAVASSRAGDARRLGALLDASHASLRDDFEVSVPEVDRLVAIAQADPGVAGARMTGGGFGGAIVVLAHRGAGADAARRIVSEYGPAGAVLVPQVSP